MAVEREEIGQAMFGPAVCESSYRFFSRAVCIVPICSIKMEKKFGRIFSHFFFD